MFVFAGKEEEAQRSRKARQKTQDWRELQARGLVQVWRGSRRQHVSGEPPACSGSYGVPGAEVQFVPQIGKMRYVSVRDFKGKVLIDIREYWMNQDGEMKPGKKGEPASLSSALVPLTRHAPLLRPQASL